MGHGQETELGLTALGHSFAPGSAGADGDLGLDELVAGALGVALGIEKAGDAGALVRLQPCICERQDDERHEGDGHPVFPAHAGEEDADGQDGNVGEGGAEVGLFGDEGHGDGDEAGEFEEVAHFEDVAVEVDQKAGDEEDDHEFGEFGDLEVDAGGEGDPAGGTEGAFADEEDGEQEEHGNQIGRVGAGDHGVIVEARGGPHEGETGGDVKDLFPPGALPDGIVGGAEDLEDAEGADGDHDGDHGPVEIAHSGG